MSSSSSLTSSSQSSSISTRANSSSSSSLSSSESLSSVSSESSSSSSEIKGTVLSFVTEGVVWNKSKFVSSETAAVCSDLVGNRLAQTVGVNSQTYKIGRISLFLRERQGPSTEDFNIFVEIFEADNNGRPSVSVDSSSKAASSITWTGWHTFDFTMEERVAPSSKLISVVVWQDGGDEDNYISWFYSPGLVPGTLALYSSDFGTSWEEHLDIVRLIKIVKPYNPFSTLCADGNLQSAVAEELIVNFSNFDEPSRDGGATYDGDHNGTITDEGEVEKAIVVSNKNLIASIVVDNSGSMGWNDRGKNKIIAATEIVSQIQAKYPGNSVFDFIKFGAIGLGPAISGGGATYSTIKLDPSNPSYVKTNNDGTLPSLEDDFIAFGFSGLEAGHTYVLQSVINGQTTLFNGAGLIDQNISMRITENVQSVGNQLSPIRFSIQGLGTGSETGGEGTFATIAEVPVSGATQIRKPSVPGRILAVSGLTEELFADRTRAFISNPTVFENGETIDFVDADGVSCSHLITGLGDTFVDVSPVTADDFGSSWSYLGGFAQQTSSFDLINIDPDSMIELLVKDNKSSENITFYAQTRGGGKIEWQFAAMKEWVVQYVSYIDRPFDLITYITDEDGNSFPSSSRIQYYIDEEPNWDGLSKQVEILLEEPVILETGDDRIYLPTINGVNVRDSVKLLALDGRFFTGYAVSEVDDVNLSIRIVPPNMEDTFELKGVIFEAAKNPNTAVDKLDVTFCGVDISAGIAGRLGTNRLPSDPPQIDLSQTDPNAYNEDRIRWINGSFDIPSINLGAYTLCAGLRLMPMTDDYLNTLSEEQAKTSALFNQSVLTDDELAELDALENQYNQLTEENPNQIIEITDNASDIAEPVIDSNDNVNSEWILSPEESAIGDITKFTSLASSMTLYTDVVNPLYFDTNTKDTTGQFGLLAKKHLVYPALKIKNTANELIARYLLSSYPVYFVSPVQIFCQPEIHKTVKFEYRCRTPEGEGICTIDVPGMYATGGKDIQLNYVVYNRGKYLSDEKLNVKIYDAFRGEIEIETNPWETTPWLEEEFKHNNFSSDSTTQIIFNNISFNRLTTDGNNNYINNLDLPFDKKQPLPSIESTYHEALYLSWYTKGGFEIDLINGKASFTIPAMDVVTRLIIKVEVVCPDNSSISCTRYDSVWIKNPVALIMQSSSRMSGGLEVAPTEVKIGMTYLNEPISDNTLISLSGSEHERYKAGDSSKVDPNSDDGKTITTIASKTGQSNLNSGMLEQSYWPPTAVKPSVGKTINGVASGFLIGPHGSVIMHTPKNSDDGDDALIGDFETFTASSNYHPNNSTLSWTSSPSFSAKGYFNVEWIGGEETFTDYIYMTWWKDGKSSGNVISCYADGWSKAIAVADAPGSKNRSFKNFDNQEMSDFLVGKTLPSKIGRRGTFTTMGCQQEPMPGRENIFYDTRPIDPDTGLEMGETDSGLSESFDNGNCVGWAATRFSRCVFISDSDTREDGKCLWPPCERINFYTNVKLPNSQLSMVKGCASDSFSGCMQLGPDGQKKDTPLMITWIEPSQINIWMNGKPLTDPYDFVRDGVTPTELWINTSFSGKPIPLTAREHNIKDINGLPIPMPKVFVDINYIKQKWDATGNLIMFDTGDYFEVFKDGTLTLTDYSPYVSICRTTTEEGHYHSCEVDDITGNGNTTGTFAEGSSTQIENHIHTVSKFILSNNPDLNGIIHSHSPLSVAITKLNPITNTTLNICLNAKFSYDAGQTPVERTRSFSTCTRLEWFDFWDMNLVFDTDLPMIQNDVTKNEDGLTVQANLKHKINGVYVPVEEGIRVNFNVSAFKINNTDLDSEDVPSFKDGKSRDYMSVKVIATAQIGDKKITKTVQTFYSSLLQWGPSVRALLAEPTNDHIYLANALSKLNGVKGSSMLYDAIVLASDRINIYKTNNPTFDSADSIMFILTDGCENQSQRTINQVASRINMIANGDRKAFIAIILFGSPSQSDVLLANKIKSDTGGVLVRIPVGYDPSLIPQVISDIFSMGVNSFNSGSYVGTIDIGGNEEDGGISGQNGIFKQACVNIDLPTGSTSTFSSRFSSDGDSWTEWTEAANLISPTTCVTLPNHKCRYMQYVIRMTGNSDFESPRVSNLEMTYFKPSTDVIFTQPIAIDAPFDEYVSEAVITHNASIPDGGELKYGTINHNTIDESDYGKNEKPWFNANERSVMLTRMNEPAYIISSKTYKALNGAWPADSVVDVFVIYPGSTNGVKIDKEAYTLNNKTGNVSFVSALENGSRVILDIKPDKVVRVAVRMVNYSTEPIKINQLTVMYNKTKRINRRSDGTIVNQTLGDEIDQSSSSESSSESSSSSVI